MKENENFLIKDIYLKHFLDIRGIKFTAREVDIIACLLSARRTSAIAHLLSIAPRTVTTHLRNIMLKLECNSQDGIIKFVEKSEQAPLLRGHYSNLLRKEAFEKSLKTLSRTLQNHEPCGLEIETPHLPLKKALLSHLKANLNLCGIDVQVTEEKDHILVGVQGRINTKVERCYLEDSEGYFEATFKILETLYPSIDIKQARQDFIKHIEGVGTSIGSKEILPMRKKSYGSLIQSKQGMGLIVFLFLFILAAVIGVQDIVFNEKETDIRSDLPLPPEAILLQRPEILQEIDNKFKQQEGIGTVTLVGIGGAGKTVLAHQYAREQKANVIWKVNAETQLSLIASFESLASALATTHEQKKELHLLRKNHNGAQREESLFLFVKQRLKSRPHWLLIYDNVEQFADIQHYFPLDSSTWGQGKVLLTTKNKNIENNVYFRDSIEIKELNQKQKLLLFTKFMGNEGKNSLISQEKTKKFLEKIPPFPLDLSNTAQYLKATNIPFEEYIELLLHNIKDLNSLQENILRESGDHLKTRYNIISLSLKKILQTNPEVKDLLFFISLLDSQHIPRDLLDKYKGETLVSKFIYDLKNFSLVSTHPPNLTAPVFTLSLHSSTQEVSLNYLLDTLSSKEKSILLQGFTSTLEAYVSNVLLQEDTSKAQLLIKHYEKLMTNNNWLSDSVRGQLTNQWGALYICLKSYDKAKNILKTNLKNLKQYGRDNENILADTQIHLGIIDYEQGKYANAKILLEEGLSTHKKNSSIQNEMIARGLIFLGNVHKELGNYKKAVETLKQSLAIYKKQDDPHEILNAMALRYLGDVYRTMGEAKEAKILLDQSAEIYKKFFPDNDEKMEEVFVNLSKVYRDLGDYKKAKSLLEKSLRIYETYFPENEIEIACVKIYLGNIFKNTGKYEKAKIIIEENIPIYRKRFKKNLVGYAWALVYLGQVYNGLGNYQKANELFEKAYDIHRNDHTESKIIWTATYLGESYLKLGEHKKAQGFLEKSFADHQRIFGTNNSRAVWAGVCLANLYREIGEYEKAKVLLSKALEIYKTQFHKNHLDNARALNILGEVFLLENNLISAEDCLLRAINIFQKNKHSGMFFSLEKMSHLYVKKSTQDPFNSKKLKSKAIDYLKQALGGVKAHFSSNSPHILRIQSKLKILQDR